MIRSIVTWLRQLRPSSSALPSETSDCGKEEPDKLRRMVLIGSAAVIGSSLLLPDAIPSAEAHSRRRRRRRRRRRHRHYHRHYSRRYYRRRRYYHGHGHGHRHHRHGFWPFGFHFYIGH